MEVEHIQHLSTGIAIAALLIFITSYVLIISEKIHRTIVALAGATLMIILGVFLDFFNQHEAIANIDFNTIGLLIGMMIIVEVSKQTGLFQYVAIKSAKIAKGEPWKILILFSVITALFSAFLDNVTTVLLLVPITIVICENLDIDPKPFILSEIFMSNIGGAATLIGDPPNILIGSAANLNFLDFIINLAPIIIVIFIFIMPLLILYYKNKIKTDCEHKENIMKLNENETIKDEGLLKKSLFIIGLVIVGLFCHGFFHLEAATIAILGAALMLFFDKKNLEQHLSKIEWSTIFFFVGLFVLVGGIVKAGIIGWAAKDMMNLTHGNLAITTTVVLWGSAFFSAFVDNIPFVATMIPLVKDMGILFTDLKPLWWSLALGACLGGNGTIVGASANLVATGMAEKSHYKICFMEFMKVGMVIMLVTVAISNVYLAVRFW